MLTGQQLKLLMLVRDICACESETAVSEAMDGVIERDNKNRLAINVQRISEDGTEILKTLEKAGYVECAGDDYCLSDKGKAYLDEIDTILK